MRLRSFVLGAALASFGAGCQLLLVFDAATEGAGDAGARAADANAADVLADAGDGDAHEVVDGGGPPHADAGPYGNAVLDDRPVAYWRLDERDGLTAFDLMNHYPGVFVGTPGHGAPSALLSDPDPSTTFDGARIDVTTKDLQFVGDAGPMTVEAWIKPNTSGSSQHVFTDQYRVNSPEGYALLLLGDDSPRFERWVGGVQRKVDGTPLTIGAWNYVAATYDGNETVVFENGAQVAVISDSRPFGAHDAPAYIAAASANANDSYPFVGALDEIAVYPYALAPDRLLAHFHAAGR